MTEKKLKRIGTHLKNGILIGLLLGMIALRLMTDGI